MVISFKKVDEKRKEKGISVTEFAKDIGISRKTYYDWEKEVVPILTKYLKPIEGVLGINIEDITEEDKSKLPEAFLQGLNVDVNKILKRVKWVINYIITQNHLSNVKLAKMLNISVSSMDNYRGGKATPKPETLAILQNIFKVSVDWIMDGRGDAFLNTSEAIKNVVDSEKYSGAPESSVVRDTMAGYGPDGLKINLDDAQGKAYRVLLAGNALSVALYMNIQQFAAALDTGQELKVCQDQMRDMQSQINELKGKVDRLTAVPTTAEDPAAGSDKEAM
jgi:transcriptional regulator with XRE-family HTH domain